MPKNGRKQAAGKSRHFHQYAYNKSTRNSFSLKTKYTLFFPVACRFIATHTKGMIQLRQSHLGSSGSIGLQYGDHQTELGTFFIPNILPAHWVCR